MLGKSCFLFSEDNAVRVWIYDIVTSNAFDYFMFTFIAISCGAMVYEHPRLVPGAVDTQVLYWLDVVLTSIFGVECLLKIVAFGFRHYVERHANKVHSDHLLGLYR